MARIPMVTRTVNGTEFTVLCMNPKTRDAFSEKIVLNAKFKTEDAMMKELRRQLDNEDRKVVVITESNPVSALYGVEESEFLKIARKLPPRTKLDD